MERIPLQGVISSEHDKMSLVYYHLVLEKNRFDLLQKIIVEIPGNTSLKTLYTRELISECTTFKIKSDCPRINPYDALKVIFMDNFVIVQELFKKYGINVNLDLSIKEHTVSFVKRQMERRFLDVSEEDLYLLTTESRDHFDKDDSKTYNITFNPLPLFFISIEISSAFVMDQSGVEKVLRRKILENKIGLVFLHDFKWKFPQEIEISQNLGELILNSFSLECFSNGLSVLLENKNRRDLRSLELLNDFLDSR